VINLTAPVAVTATAALSDLVLTSRASAEREVVVAVARSTSWEGTGTSNAVVEVKPVCDTVVGDTAATVRLEPAAFAGATRAVSARAAAAATAIIFLDI
jgi:hypothetical protein